MGFFIVLLLQLVFVFVLSLAIAFIGLLIVYFIQSPRKGRLYLFAFHAPFVTCYAFYFCLLAASVFISQKYEVDSGVGDSWYVPLTGESRLEMIDLPEAASIMKGDKSIIDGVVKLYQYNDSVVWGKTFDKSCFIFNGDTLIYEKESILVAQRNQGQPIAWQATDTFYRDRKEAIAGTANNIALVASVAVALMVVWILKRIVLGKAKRKA